MASPIFRALDAAWIPTSQQTQELDTSWMQDPAGDAALGLAPAFSGLLVPNGATTPNTAAGKFLQGYNPGAATNSYYWMPMDGLLNPDEWTIELWAKATADWFTFTNVGLLSFGTISNGVGFAITSAGVFRLQLQHQQNPASPSGYSKEVDYTFATGTGTIPAGTWVSIAATLKGGVMSLFWNGTQVGQVSSVVAPLYLGATARNDGLWLPANSGNGQSNTAFTVSDVRLGRQARVPGQQTIIASDRSTITVSSTPTGTTVAPLPGSLKSVIDSLSPAPSKSFSDAVIALQQSTAAAKSIRVGQILQSTPIATSNPGGYTAGGSAGSPYFYDWQVCDRALTFISQTLGCEPIVALGGTPQILGGSTAPFSNAVLTTSASAQTPDVSGTLTLTSAAAGGPNFFGYGGNVYAYTGGGTTVTGVTLVSGTPGLSIPGGSSVNVGKLLFGYPWSKNSYAAGPPSSPSVATASANFATMAADLADHVLNHLTLTNPPKYWTLWNEPDGILWTTTVADFYTLHGEVGTALKAISSAIKFGGPGTSNWDGLDVSWSQGLINYCATNSKPLDFFDWHTYSGDLTEFGRVQIQVDAWAATAGISIPEFTIGEWAWQGANSYHSPWYQTGATPTNYEFNDWNAAYRAAGMIQAQARRVVRTTWGALGATNIGNCFFDTSGVGGLIAGGNVARLWNLLYSTVVGCTGPQTVACDPGIHAIATTNGAGKYRVMVANLHYRKQGLGSKGSYPVLVNLPAGVIDGTAVTVYMVDDQHSNAYDAGIANAGLQTVSTTLSAQGTNKVANGQVGITLRPRAAALLVIG